MTTLQKLMATLSPFSRQPRPTFDIGMPFLKAAQRTPDSKRAKECCLRKKMISMRLMSIKYDETKKVVTSQRMDDGG